MIRRLRGAENRLVSARDGAYGPRMEKLFRMHIERLPEGMFLATSDEIQGLVAQGRTVNETVEIARDVARRLIESQSLDSGAALGDSFDYPLVVTVEA